MQVARLERELSAIVAEGFLYILAPHPAVESFLGPRLLSLGELERSRDPLATRVQEYRRRVDNRAEHERRAHELLRRMKLQPARYQYVRLPVTSSVKAAAESGKRGHGPARSGCSPGGGKSSSPHVVSLPRKGHLGGR
jgi:hypothetical protein